MLQANFNNVPQRIVSVGSFSRQLHKVSCKKDYSKSEARIRAQDFLKDPTPAILPCKGHFLKGLGLKGKKNAIYT